MHGRGCPESQQPHVLPPLSKLQRRLLWPRVPGWPGRPGSRSTGPDVHVQQQRLPGPAAGHATGEHPQAQQAVAQPRVVPLLRPRPGPLAVSSPAVLRTSLNAPLQASAEPPAAPGAAQAPPLTSRSEPAPGSLAAAGQHRREPSTLEFLRRSGIFPAQGPLAASHDALLQGFAQQPAAAGRPGAGDQAGGDSRALVNSQHADQQRRQLPDSDRMHDSPVSRAQLHPPPQHLRTPTLMQRAGACRCSVCALLSHFYTPY